MKFDADKLGQMIEARCAEVCFALLHGSAKEGDVRPGGDIDIALDMDGRAPLETFGQVIEIVSQLAPGVKCDPGVLNGAEPVYRFEALKGRLLFCRDQERYVDFFSLTCREYESQMADYQRQHKYRLEYQERK